VLVSEIEELTLDPTLGDSLRVGDGVREGRPKVKTPVPLVGFPH